MTLLAAKLYDPGTAVSKVSPATGTGLAMTAFDTTNLRLTFTAPSTGNVCVVIQCAATLGTTFLQLLLGVMSGASVVGRASPIAVPGGTGLASTRMLCDATFEVTGLTPGTSYTWDAAYDVEVALTNAAINYGGPNNASGANAWGAFRYAIYAV